MDKCTIVTAYYSIKSKRPAEYYFEWASNFMQLEAPVVLFTDPSNVDLLKSLRGERPLHIIAIPFEEIYMWKKYEILWKEHYLLDREANIHSPELYAVWSNKVVWLDEAAKLNIFNTKFFLWCDFGAFRDNNAMHLFKTNFPITSYFPEDKMLFGCIHPFISEDYDITWSNADKKIVGDFFYKDRIVAGFWGGNKFACTTWRQIYENTLLNYFEANRFAGKEQSIMMSALLESKFGIVARVSTNVEPWFFMEYLLSGHAEFQEESSFIKTMH